MSELQEIYDEYLISKPLPLPYTTRHGLIIGEFHCSCRSCLKELTHMRGTLEEYSQCVEIKPIAICEECKAIMRCDPARFYADGRVMVNVQDEGWVEMEAHSRKLPWFWIGAVSLSIIVSVLILLL